MAEFSLTAYLVAGSSVISGAFGSGDASIKERVVSHPTVKASAGNFHNGSERISDGLDRIISTAQFDAYHYNLALGIEMLYAAYGSALKNQSGVAVTGYTEDCLAALQAMNLPTLHNAMNTLAWGEEVALPLPVSAWDDVTGQFYFSAETRKTAISELQSMGKLEDAIDRAENTTPDAFDECDVDELESTLTYFQSILKEAESSNMDIAVFRHGGV